MADLKVNSDQIIQRANKIKTLNTQMSNDYDAVKQAITKLDKKWDSAAATNTIGKFNAISNSYCKARYDVVDNFVAFLYHQVGEGYAQTESVNKSLADQFK